MTSSVARTCEIFYYCIDNEQGRQRYCEKYRAWVLLSLALVITSISPGLIYGWPALRLQLQVVDKSALTEAELGLMYTVGSWSTQGGRFFFGLARDQFGTSSVTFSSLLILVAGLVGVGVCGSNQLGVWIFCLFLIGLGSGAQLCVQPVAGLFPNHAGVILSSLSGAFQISGLIFLILTAGGGSRKVPFLAFSVVVFFFAVLSAVFLPTGNSFLLPCQDERPASHDVSVSDAEKSDEDDNTSANHGNTSQQSEYRKEPSLEPTSQAGQSVEVAQEDCVSPPPTALDQMKTREYVLLCLWFSLSIIPMQYYVAVIGYELEGMGDEDGVYTDIFSYCFAGAAVSAPLAGWIADRFGLGIAQGVSTMLIAIPHFLLASRNRLPSLKVHTLGLALYGVGRMGNFGLYFTNCGKRFGYANYGTLAGLGLLASSIASILQYPLITATVNGHSKNVNLSLGIVLLLQAPYFSWLQHREKDFDSALSY